MAIVHLFRFCARLSMNDKTTSIQMRSEVPDIAIRNPAQSHLHTVLIAFCDQGYAENYAQSCSSKFKGGRQANGKIVFKGLLCCQDSSQPWHPSRQPLAASAWLGSWPGLGSTTISSIPPATGVSCLTSTACPPPEGGLTT